MSGSLLPITIAAMALLTFALRTTFLLLHERLALPLLVRRALRYVPYAVLAALLVPAVVAGDDGSFAPQLPRLLAGLVGLLIAWRSGSVILTLVCGMSTLWLAQLL